MAATVMTLSEGALVLNETPFRILVVDDEPDLVVLLEEHLSQEGYEVITATTGMQAIAKARAEQPDLILLDVMMPGVSGFDVCNILQDFPETASIPVIFLTAVAETKRKVMGLNLGADDYITKPFDLHELAARVQAALRPRLGHIPAPDTAQEPDTQY